VEPPQRLQILVYDDDFAGWPSKVASFVHQSVLSIGRLAVVFDLSRAGLAQIDNSHTGEMARSYLEYVTHCRSPVLTLQPAFAQINRERSTRAAICARGSIWSQGPFDPSSGSTGRSRSANYNCIITLLFGGRLDEPAQKSVRDGARLKQIADRAKMLGGVYVITCEQHQLGVLAAAPVRPRSRNKRAAAVGQNHEQLENAPPGQAPDDRKSASFKRMPFPRDDGRNLNVLVMGSLSYLRSTISITSCCSRLSGSM
jgi:hypothetical protein